MIETKRNILMKYEFVKLFNKRHVLRLLVIIAINYIVLPQTSIIYPKLQGYNPRALPLSYVKQIFKTITYLPLVQ